MSSPAPSSSSSSSSTSSTSSTFAWETPDAEHIRLAPNSNQALGIAHYAIDFLSFKLGQPSEKVLKRTEDFHTDSVVCGLSALALGTNAPSVLRAEALDYPAHSNQLSAKVFGSNKSVITEKAIVANVSAVREWDSNGTVFGFNPRLGAKHMAGEFGHNDFYPAVVAACQAKNLSGKHAIYGMLCLDEIRGRLAEVFSLKTYHIDHVVHGAIASAAVYGALVGATPQQIESAIGMVRSKTLSRSYDMQNMQFTE
jgi:2-methylcitrate dehydratase